MLILFAAGIAQWLSSLMSRSLSLRAGIADYHSYQQNNEEGRNKLRVNCTHSLGFIGTKMRLSGYD